MVEKNQLTTCHLIAVNSVVTGLETAACVAFSYIPPLLLKTGFSESCMSVILGIAPLIALFTVPGLGRWSDTCSSSLGRRRPVILLMSLLLVISLLILCTGQALNESRVMEKMVLLSVGGVMLDYASQAAINPCEALMSDMMAEVTEDNEGGEEAGFMVYSTMLSVGGCLGYFLVAVDLSSLGLNVGGGAEGTAFLLVLVLYLSFLTITMVATTEKQFVKHEEGELAGQDCHTQDCRRSVLFSQISRHLFQSIKKVVLLPVSHYRTVSCAPKALKMLYYVDLLSWVGIMAHRMYFTDFVGQAVFGGQPYSSPGSHHRQLFDEGVRIGSVSLLFHSITACVYPLLVQHHVTRLIGLRRSYQLGLAVFSLCMAITLIFPKNLYVLHCAGAVSGVGFSVTTTVPNILVTLYHSQPDIFYGNANRGGVGEDIAILDSGYFLSQILLSLVMGKLVELAELTHLYVGVAGLASGLAVLLINSVVCTREDALARRFEEDSKLLNCDKPGQPIILINSQDIPAEDDISDRPTLWRSPSASGGISDLARSWLDSSYHRA